MPSAPYLFYFRVSELLAYEAIEVRTLGWRLQQAFVDFGRHVEVLVRGMVVKL